MQIGKRSFVIRKEIRGNKAKKDHECVKREKKNKKGKPCTMVHIICDQDDLKLHPVAGTSSVFM